MNERAARVLLFDLETSPNVGYCWGKWEQDIIEFLSERQIICFSYEWLDTGEHGTFGLPDFKGYRKNKSDNKLLILKLHEIISKADIVVGHNVDFFDDKRANTDFIKHGLTPPPQHKTVDTLRVVKSKFDFNSNKLNDLGRFLNIGEKVKHWGFELWRRCLEGDKKAWRLMKKYNRQDVVLLRKVYLKVRPWMPRHPTVRPASLLGKDSVCPRCHSRKLSGRGTYLNAKGRIPRFQCLDCGHWCSVTVIRGAHRIKT